MHPADSLAAYLAGIIVGAVATAATIVAATYGTDAVYRAWRWIRGDR